MNAQIEVFKAQSDLDPFIFEKIAQLIVAGDDIDKSDTQVNQYSGKL